MRHSLRKRNNIMIGALCLVLLLMVAGYAAFSTRLDISSGASVNSKWDIEITNIRGGNPEGGDAYDITPPTYTKTSANFSTGLITPGTSDRVYEVEISNLGNLAGYVTIGNLSCGDNEAIDCWAFESDMQEMTDSGEWGEESKNYIDFDYGQNDYSSIGFSIEPEQKHYLYIDVWYRNVTSQPENLNANIKLDLVYAQDESVAPEPLLKTVYAYHTDRKYVGTTKLNASEYVTDYTMIDGYSASRPWFLKYEIDKEGLIKNAYTCQKLSFIAEPVCLQGGNAEYYSANKTILEGLKPTFESNSGSCTLEDSHTYCDAGGFKVGAAPYNVGAGNSNSSAYCYVDYSGYALCY